MIRYDFLNYSIEEFKNTLYDLAFTLHAYMPLHSMKYREPDQSTFTATQYTEEYYQHQNIYILDIVTHLQRINTFAPWMVQLSIGFFILSTYLYFDPPPHITIISPIDHA